MHQIVHLDLKGAPPNVSYLEKVLIQIKKWGGTGVLLEWEDTFPYDGELLEIGSLGNQSHGDQASRSGSGGDGMYSIEEVKHLIQYVKELGIEAVTYSLGDLVQPVIWHYNPAECFNIDRSLWDVYRQIFPAVWAGSAFKGANGSCQVLSPVTRYVSNHQAWLREIKANQHHITFNGVILTGWSRFDHYATLCELLPVSLPSLASCLRVLVDDQSTTVSEVLPSDQWPGEQLARCVHSYVILRERCLALLHGDLVTTWLNPWQMEHDFTNPTQIEGLAINARHLTTELSCLTAQLSSHLHSFTGKRSTEEWLATFIEPIAVRLTDVTAKAEERAAKEAGVRPIGY